MRKTAGTIWRGVRIFCAALGAAMLIVTLTPVTSWAAARLAGPWNDPHGAVLVVLSGSGSDQGMLGESSYWRAFYAALAWREGRWEKIVLLGGGNPPASSAMKTFLEPPLVRLPGPGHRDGQDRVLSFAWLDLKAGDAIGRRSDVALSPIKRIDTFLIERFSNSSPVQFGWALFFLGCLVRIGLVFATHYYRYTLPPDTEDEWLRVAANLAAGRGFVKPYCCESGPTGHVSPGFAYLLAAEYLLVRGPMRAIVISVVSCIVSSAVYAMTPWLAESLGFSRLSGRWAGLAGAAVPLVFWIEVCGVLEAPYIALALVIGVALTLGAKSLRGLALSGAAWGAGFWFAPNALPVMLGCAAVAISRLPRRAACLALSC